MTGDRLGSVRLAPSRDVSVNNGIGRSDLSGARGGGGTVVNNYGSDTVNYVTNVTYANDCWNSPGWCSPVYGPGSCWQSWDCDDNFSFSIGFGTGGFSFGLFYGSCNAPLSWNWCNPWWCGWSTYTYYGCGPSWGWCNPCWSPCGGPWWSNYTCYSYYPSWCVPVYAYTPAYAIPTYSYVDYYYYDSLPATFTSTEVLYASSPPSVVTVAPPPTVAMSAAESEAWDLLSNGFPRSAGDTFARLHDLDPRNARALTGYAISLAMLDDIPAAAAVMRDAIAVDVGIVATMPLGPSLTERVRLLEKSAEIASRQSNEAADALLLLGVWRTAQGRFTEAHFAIVVAQQQGDASLATATLKAYLEARMGGRA